MLYSEANRLAFRWRIVAGSLVLAVAYVVLAAIPAYATTWPGPDDGAGKYAHCNVWVYYSSISNNPLQEFACQYTLGTTGTTTNNKINTSTGGLNFGTFTYACTGTCSTSSSGTTSSFTSFDTNGGTGVNQGHAIRDTHSFGLNGAGSVTSASYSGCSVTFDNGGVGGVPVGSVACVIDSVSLNAAPTPLLPANNYPGASAGPALDATQGTSACPRTLTGTDAMTAEFSQSRTGMANATVTAYDLDFGDSTTHATTAGPTKHTYGALSTQPSSGWTATWTFTITATSGHLFSDGTSSKTGTCATRVDFLHPDQVTAGSTGGGSGSTGDSGLDACLPTGWSTLNPLAWIGGLGCVIKYLFIPQSSTITALGHTWDTATTKVPFSVVYDAVTYIPQTLDDFKYAVTQSSPITGTGADRGDLICQPFDHFACNGSGHTAFYGTAFGGGRGHSVPGAILVTRDVLLFIIVVSFLYACWRGAGEILK